MRWIALLGLCWMLCSFTPLAPPSSIQELQAQYQLLQALHEQGQLPDSTFEAQTAALEQWSLERFDLDLNRQVLDQAVSAQRIDWLGSALYIGAALVLLMILGPLLRKLWLWGRNLLRRLWEWQPLRLLLIRLGKLAVMLWEPFSYVLCAGLLYAYPHELVVLLVSAVLSSLITYSIYSRQPEQKFTHNMGTLTAWILTLLWGGIAYYFDHTWVGVGAVGAFLAALGFVLFYLPGVEWGRFRHADRLMAQRMTILLLLLSVLSALIFNLDAVPALAALRLPLRPFEFGWTTLVPIAYFSSLGYLVFNVYGYKTSFWKRVLARLVGLGFAALTLVVAIVFQIGSLFWIGSFFTLILIIERYYDLFYKKIDPIWTGLLVALSLAAAGYALKQHLSTVVDFLAQLGW